MALDRANLSGQGIRVQRPTMNITGRGEHALTPRAYNAAFDVSRLDEFCEAQGVGFQALADIQIGTTDAITKALDGNVYVIKRSEGGVFYIQDNVWTPLTGTQRIFMDPKTVEFLDLERMRVSNVRTVNYRGTDLAILHAMTSVADVQAHETRLMCPASDQKVEPFYDGNGTVVAVKWDVNKESE